HEGIDAKRPVCADEPRPAPLQEFESRPPHQRSVGENPQLFAALVGLFAHRSWIATMAEPQPLTGPGGLSRNRPYVPAQPIRALRARTRGAETPYWQVLKFQWLLDPDEGAPRAGALSGY